MADITFAGLDGFAGMEAALRRQRQAVQSKVERAVRDSGTSMGRRAKAEAPVLTGRLKSEIDTEHAGLEATTTSPTPYAHWVNAGTSRQAPNEYMGRAFRATEPDFLDNLSDAIGIRL